MTIAGNGRIAYAGDGGPATSASLFFPAAVAVDAAGNVYVADTDNYVIRVLSPIADSAQPPAITAAFPVPGYGGFQSVAPGSSIEINGSDLAGTARSWTAADFSGVIAPTALSGTSVTIGGLPAVISYVSGSQVNAVVPSNLASGQQPVTVSTINGTSPSFPIQVDPSQAGLLAPSVFDVGNGSFALPSNAVTGVNTRPARAGETMNLYGIGFGPVSPAVPYGQITEQDNTLTGTVRIFIGGTEASVPYKGLAPQTVGLYQFNVVVPSGVTGDALPLTFTFNGVTSPETLYTAVQN